MSDMTGKVTFENGWTLSVIAEGSLRGVPVNPSLTGLYETWAWHEDGRTDEDVQRYLTADAVREVAREVAAR